MRVRRHPDDDRFFDIEELDIHDAGILGRALKMALEQCDHDRDHHRFDDQKTREGIQGLIDTLKSDINKTLKQDPDRDEDDEWDDDFPFI